MSDLSQLLFMKSHENFQVCVRETAESCFETAGKWHQTVNSWVWTGENRCRKWSDWLVSFSSNIHSEQVRTLSHQLEVGAADSCQQVLSLNAELFLWAPLSSNEGQRAGSAASAETEPAASGGEQQVKTGGNWWISGSRCLFVSFARVETVYPTTN